MPDSAQMIIANRLRDGLTVFRGADGTWVESIGAGALAQSPDEAQRLLAAAAADAARNLVVDPYLIAITVTERGPRPVSWREVIRAFGPTVETGAGT